MFIPNVLNAINRFIKLSDEGNIDAGRSDLYALAFSLFKTSPLLGIGWGKYKYIYAALNPLDIFTIQVHNVYLQLLCETGIFGFIIFVSAFIASFVFAVRLFVNYRKKKIELPENSSYILMFSLFMQTFFLLYCFTGNPLYDFQMLYPYLMSVGIVQYYKFNFIRRNKNAKKIRNYNLPQSS
jgi:O-antigen ligase